jgi:ribosomal protein S18 acetylase RimI-like enzyme
MQIRNLEGIPIETIVESLLEAFSDYFVKMPAEVAYWESRFKGAGVDWKSSFGIFDGRKLVAFIIHGIDLYHSKLTAFNTGTGVLPAYRSRKAVDQLYEFAIPHFRRTGVEKCILEVIRKNFRAIRVYERIGFRIIRKLKCFEGSINTGNEKFRLEKVAFEEVNENSNVDNKYYSWDNFSATIERADGIYQTFLVRDHQDREAGYFVINPNIGYVAQLEMIHGPVGVVFKGLSQVSKEVRLNNIDEARTDLIDMLLKKGLVNTVNQYEMEMLL